MKKTILFSAFLFTSMMYADGDLVADAQYMGGKVSQPVSNNNNHSLMSVNTLTSANPESEFGWYLFADPLYWHIDVGSTDWATANRTVDGPLTSVHNHTLDFKWNWGYRVGIGANTSHDMWDTCFYYTWLFADCSNKIGRDAADVIDQIGMGDIANLNTGSIKWDIHFSMFDWEMARWSYISKNLALRPHVGVKGGWIHQKMNTKFENFGNTKIHEHSENDYWGVGPSAGIGSTWVLFNLGATRQHRFCLNGDFGGALMYGHFDVTNRQHLFDATGAEIAGFNQKGLDRNLATAMLQAFMGLSWDLSFNDDKNHFMLDVGYEFQYWFRQNQFVQTTVTTNPLTVKNRRISDDLSLQGITAQIRFDF